VNLCKGFSAEYRLKANGVEMALPDGLIDLNATEKA